MSAYRQEIARMAATRTQTVDRLVIRPTGQFRALARLGHAGRTMNCLCGHGGILPKLGEGDGKTPLGIWHPLYFLYRKDRICKPVSLLPGFAINETDNWCDNPQSNHYNQPLATLPTKTEENLWRKDNLYDLVIVLDHNMFPASKNRGSAIFLHLAGKNTAFTHGCIAFSPTDILQIVSRIGPHTSIELQR